MIKTCPAKGWLAEGAGQVTAGGAAANLHHRLEKLATLLIRGLFGLLQG